MQAQRQSSEQAAELQARRDAVRRGFTLIEIMMTVAIIVILMAVVIAVSSNVMRNAQENQTKVTLKQLVGIASAYERDTGLSLISTGPTSPLATYAGVSPFDDNGSESPPYINTAAFIKAVGALPELNKQLVAMGTKIYVIDPSDPKKNRMIVLDGFQQQIRFRTVGTPPTSYYFSSDGPDGIINTASKTSLDDIVSNQP